MEELVTGNAQETDPDSSESEGETEKNDIQQNSEKPKRISDQMREKFQALQARRQQITKSSTEKRIRTIQQKALKRVADELNSSDDKAELFKQGVSFPEDQTSKKKKTGTSDTGSATKPSSSGINEENQEEWMAVRQYIGINDHLKGTDKGKYAEKTKLEERIDAAIANGDIEEAEKLSEQLASREFGKKIADAMDAKKFSEEKQKQVQLLKERQKKKLHWGFDHKQRWETKSNM